MIHFVTSADGSYLARAVCLIDSFLAQKSAGTFWLFARDADTTAAMAHLAMPGVNIVAEADYNTPVLRNIRAMRSPLEYACTLKPVFLRHVMDRVGNGDWVIWLDGDMFFFQPAERIVPPAPGSVLLSPHRFTQSFANLQPTVGAFNAGLAGFAKSPGGEQALTWWTERCLEWCKAVADGERYADQKYLEAMPRRFGDVVHAAPGVNAGPWNAIERCVTGDGPTIRIGGDPLVLYHFQGLRVLHRRCYDLYADDRQRVPAGLRRLVYRPYVHALQQASERVNDVMGNVRRDNPAWPLLRVAKRLLLRQGNLVFV